MKNELRKIASEIVRKCEGPIERAQFWGLRLRIIADAIRPIGGDEMNNKYQLLANKWKNQADESTDEHEQAWLYACAGDLEALIKAAEPLPLNREDCHTTR